MSETHLGFYEKKTAMGTEMTEINPNTQHSLKAQKKRYEKAKLMRKSIKFTSPYDAIVTSQSDPRKVFHVHFRLKDDRDQTSCDCESWCFGIAREDQFHCKHIIGCLDLWEELNVGPGHPA